MGLEAIVARFRERGFQCRRQADGGYRCQCPGHAGADRNLVLHEVENGKVLADCKVIGCELEKIAAPVGLQVSDFMGSKVNGSRAEQTGWDPDWVAKGHIPYRYDDEKGRRAYRSVRTPQKEFYLQRWIAAKKRYVSGLNGAVLPPFRLDRIFKAKREQLIFWFEGEKDCLTGERLGLLCTTSAGGAQGYPGGLGRWFQGRTVVIVPDNDEPGRSYAETVRRDLSEYDCRAVILELPGLAEKEDFTDWHERHGGTKEALLEMAEALIAPPPEPWEQPVALDWAAAPEFPVETLPAWGAAMVRATAESLQTQLDVPALLFLGLLSVAFQKRVQCVVREDWTEPLSIWALNVQLPGSRKSQVFSRLKAPVIAYEEEQTANMAGEVAAAEAEHRILQGRLKRLEDQAIKGKTEFDRDRAMREAKMVAADLETHRVPTRPRLVVDDATPEKLSMLLANNGGRMAVLSAEGGIFDIMAGKYSSGSANLDLYLAGHSGDDYVSDRVGRSNVTIRGAALAFVLTVQPDVLQGFAAKPSFRGRGLLGRFLYAMPPPVFGRREPVGTPIPWEVGESWNERMKQALETPADIGPDGQPRPHNLTLEPDAHEVVIEAQCWMEPRLGILGDLRHMTDWAGKAVGQMVRIGALIHLGWLCGTPEPWKIPVGVDAMRAARQVLEYLIPHAQAAYQVMGMDKQMQGARHILEWLQNQGPPWFTRRSLYRRLEKTFQRVEDLDEPLSLLVDRGFLRQRPDDRHGKKGRKSIAYDLHPAYVRCDEPLTD